MSNSNKVSAENSAQTAGISFSKFELSDLILVTLAREGLTAPTPIQALSIPLLLQGKDLIGLAQTGTGKTAAFLLPLMTHLNYGPAVRAGQPPKALILAPTRELASQIGQNVIKLSTDLNLRHLTVFGGARYDAQIRSLRRGVDIVVATPGRLEDLMDRGAFDPSGITHFVLDEADHMLDLGFYPPIKRIASSLPRKRQTMLFSATMPTEIKKLANEFLIDPANIKAPQTEISADNVTQQVTLMAESDKRDKLCFILNQKETHQTLIFVRTKRRADALAKFMSVRGFAVDALHGDMRQSLRQKVLRNFRSEKLQALIATDVAARGIDVAGLSHVINFDMTDTPEAYVHRIGRTGRAGLGGLAISFCAPDERHKLKAIISLVGARVKIFELDGSPVTDFRSEISPSHIGSRSPKRMQRSSKQNRGNAGDEEHDRNNRRKNQSNSSPKNTTSHSTRPRKSKLTKEKRTRNTRNEKWLDENDRNGKRSYKTKKVYSKNPKQAVDKVFTQGKNSLTTKTSPRAKSSDSENPANNRAKANEKSDGAQIKRIKELGKRKSPFSRKPSFNKRPNFGDKSVTTYSDLDTIKNNSTPRSLKTKKRNIQKNRATPKGGQGMLKRRR